MEVKSEVEVEQKRQRVLAEIETWKESNPDHPLLKLNNFIHYLPDSSSKTGSKKTDLVSGFRRSLNDPHAKFIADKEAQKYYSDLYLKQTPREFLETFHTAIKNLPEISISKIEELIDTRNKSLTTSQDVSAGEKALAEKSQKSHQALIDLYQYTLPLYIELRVMGYNHHELTA